MGKRGLNLDWPQQPESKHNCIHCMAHSKPSEVSHRLMRCGSVLSRRRLYILTGDWSGRHWQLIEPRLANYNYSRKTNSEWKKQREQFLKIKRVLVGVQILPNSSWRTFLARRFPDTNKEKDSNRFKGAQRFRFNFKPKKFSRISERVSDFG